MALVRLPQRLNLARVTTQFVCYAIGLGIKNHNGTIKLEQVRREKYVLSRVAYPTRGQKVSPAVETNARRMARPFLLISDCTNLESMPILTELSNQSVRIILGKDKRVNQRQIHLLIARLPLQSLNKYCFWLDAGQCN